MNVLVVDDDPLIREMLDIVLQAEGHTVMIADNGDIALRRMRESVPDVVVTDIIMPIREGIETIREIRKLYSEMPIIAMSGGGRLHALSLLDVARKFGANAALAKPFRPDQLLAKLEEVRPRG